MDIKGEQLCRLCLKVAKKEFGKIDQLVDQLLDVLMLKLDLRIPSDCIVCQDCIEVAKKCLNYKYTCIRTERIMLSFSTGKETVRHSIKDVYKKRKHLVRVNNEYLNICRFCLTRLERNSYVPLGNLLNGTMSEMLIEYMPELDFAAIDTPIICTTCKGGLEDYVKFVLNCLNVEEKIKTYFMEEGADNMGWVKKKLDTQFWLKDILEYTDICPEFCKVNVESNIFEETECLYSEEYSGLIKFEKIGTEEDITLKEYSSKNQLELRIDTYDDAFPYKENHKETASSSIVSLETTYANIENIERTQANVSLSSICDDPLEVKRNKSSDLVINDLTASNVETKHRNNVLYDQGDMSVHKGVAKIIIYKCPSCPYESKRKYNLQMHMLIHKDVSEIKMYKCSSCPYEAKRLYFLKRHMLVHKDVSELKMRKCPLCSFETRDKSNLNKHMVVHKDISEIKMYKCSLCTYEAKQNRVLKKHMLIHKDISEIQTYNCSFCAYVGKRKYDVTKHMLVHKDASELKMYKCPLCAYEAKRRFSLTKHMLIHKDVSEIQMHKCSLCAYATKQKGDVTRHMLLVHKEVSERKM